MIYTIISKNKAVVQVSHSYSHKFIKSSLLEKHRIISKVKLRTDIDWIERILRKMSVSFKWSSIAQSISVPVDFIITLEVRDSIILNTLNFMLVFSKQRKYSTSDFLEGIARV